MYFKDKTIWLTGASSGIGKALAIALSKQGARLILSSRNEKQLQLVAEECLQYTSIVSIQALDLENYEKIPSIVEKTLKGFPQIDILINNAGISQRALAKNTQISVDKKIMDINFLGTIALTKAILPSMLKHDLGHIVTITSLVGKFGTPLRSTYAASKHALHGFFDSLRAELQQEKKSIDISLICPGYIKTRITFNAVLGDGSSQNSMDEAQANGMSAERFAQICLKKIQKKKYESYIGKKEILGVYLKRFLPKTFAKLISRVKVT